jgi:serine/threonine protein kinase
MNGSVDFWLGQLLSLVFYLMTILVYNRAKKEYVGGKIAAAINLIIVCLAILLLTDFIDYFLLTLVSIQKDIVTIAKILLKLTAICVLFFGGLRFFSTRSDATDLSDDPDFLADAGTELPASDVQAGAPHAGETAVLEKLTPQKNPRLGRYEIIEQIGKGAMGIVYKGRDPKLNRLTAIKTIRFVDEFDEDKIDQIKAQFYREAEVVAKLSHKNIVRLYDVGEDLDLSYLAMEYLEGQSLVQHTSRHNLLPLNQCIEYLIQVCDALHYAHLQGVIHRDIKPGNIMIQQDGLAKVMDFGIARAAGGTKTRTGVIKGTPFYMSPEQAKGGEITGASDIFALGVLFYQLLTGKLPFTGENLATIMYQAANEAPEPVTAVKPDLDPRIVLILDKALEKDPKMRFASAGDMAEALRDCISSPFTAQTELADDMAFAKSSEPLGFQSGSKQESQETINLSELEKVLTADSDVPIEKTQGTDLVDEASPLDSPSEAEVTLEDETVKKGFNLTELREIMAAGKKRENESPVEPDDLGDEQTYEPVKGVQSDHSRELLATDSLLQELEDPVPDSAAPFQTQKKALPGYTFPVAYAVLALILIGWGYYFFWASPNADNRLFKLIYYRYFDSKGPNADEIAEAQKKLVQQIMQQKLAEKQQSEQEQTQKEAEEKEQARILEEKKKEQVALAQQEIDAQKKLETERQAKLALEKQQEVERLRRIEAEKIRKANRLAKEAEEKRLALEKQLQLERERQQAVLQKKLAKIESLVASADASRQNRKYTEAKNGYSKALKAIDQSDQKDNAMLMQQKIDIQAKLLQDDMVYGPKGYIEYKGQWLPPEAYETARYQEGYVKYKGKLIDHRDLRQLVRSKTEPLVDAHVMSKFGGETVHKKDIKYRRMLLEESTSSKSRFRVDYTWEIWLFKGITEGNCSIEMAYEVAKDTWKINKGCE